MKLLALFVTAAIGMFAGPSLSPAPEGLRAPMVQEEMRWHGWVPTGQVIEINNVHGNVRAEAAKGDEIEVIALKEGSDDPAEVSIEVVEHKGGVTICAVYPNANSDHPFDCRPSHGGGFRMAATSDSEAHIRWENGGGGDILLNDLRVDFVVRVPRRLRFIGRTVDGEVSAHLPDQDVEAHSVLGNISVDMNPAVGADVRAETAMGQVISCDFPLQLHSDHNHGLSAFGHFGRARRMIRARTGTGNIYFESAPRLF